MSPAACSQQVQYNKNIDRNSEDVGRSEVKRQMAGEKMLSQHDIKDESEYISIDKYYNILRVDTFQQYLVEIIMRQQELVGRIFLFTNFENR